MNFFNVLTFTATLLSVSCSASVTTSALPIEMKVSTTDFPDSLNFNKRFKGTPQKPTPSMKFSEAFRSFKSSFFDEKNRALSQLEAEKTTINAVEALLPSDFKEDDPAGSIINEAFGVIDEEKLEWTARQKSFEGIESYLSMLSIAQLPGKLNDLKTNADLIMRQIQGCSGQSLLNCYRNNQYFDYNSKLVPVVKAWIYGNQMFNESQNGVIPSQYIKPNWKSVIDGLNNPAGRFSILSIPAEMNSGSGDVNAADFRKKIQDYMAGSGGTEEKLIRGAVLTAFLPRQSAIPVFPRAEINKRVKVFERFAEAIARRIQKDSPFANDVVVTRFVKAWLMAIQMFRPDGVNDPMVVKYAVIRRTEPAVTVTNVPQEKDVRNASDTVPVVPANTTASNSAVPAKEEQSNPISVQKPRSNSLGSTDSERSSSSSVVSKDDKTNSKKGGIMGSLKSALGFA